jgi:hypothetical protein
MDWEKQIVERYGEEYIFRQLAEEAAELCQASLKKVRAMRHETPVSEKDAKAHVLEEIADVEVMLVVLRTAVLNEEDAEKIISIYREKRDRMIDRMLEGECLDSDGR